MIEQYQEVQSIFVNRTASSVISDIEAIVSYEAGGLVPLSRQPGTCLVISNTF